MMRQAVKTVAKQLGVYPYLLSAYKAALKNPLYKSANALYFESRFGDVDRFTLDVRGEHFVFSTEDWFSKRWFFPRYAGGKLHEPEITALMLRELETARVFADVGALVGYYSVLAAKLMRGGEVFAFELDETNHALMEKNFALNDLRNVHAIHAAVADKPGTLQYRRADTASGGVFKLARNRTQIDPSELRPARAIPLDEAFPPGKEPDIVKIDVEGAEILVVRGMQKLLATKQPRLFLEIHPNTIQGFDATASDLVKLVRSYGYQLHHIGPRSRLTPLHGDVVEHNEMFFCTPARAAAG